MPIEVQCQKCNQKLRAPDNLAGKQAKCPKCAAAIIVEGPASESVQKRKASNADSKPSMKVKPLEWYMQTDEGESYGPISRSELDTWVQEARVDSSCQVLQEGWDQWKWAEEVYPELGESGDKAEESPLAGIGSSYDEFEDFLFLGDEEDDTEPCESSLVKDEDGNISGLWVPNAFVAEDPNLVWFFLMAKDAPNKLQMRALAGDYLIDPNWQDARGGYFVMFEEGGCFIATACYGSPDCSQVLTLRRFRDQVLLSSTLGSFLVRLYYRISPGLAHSLQDRPMFRHLIVRLLLDPFARVVRCLL